MEQTREWMERRAEELRRRRQQLEEQLREEERQLCSAKDAAAQHVSARESMEAETEEELRVASATQQRREEELEALSLRRAQQAELWEKKRQLCQDLEAARQQLQTGAVEAQQRAEVLAGRGEKLQRGRKELQKQEQALERLEEVKARFIAEASEEKKRRQELREKMRCWLAAQENELSLLRARAAAAPAEAQQLRSQAEAQELRSQEALAEERQLLARLEELRRLIPLYTEQRQDLLEQIRDMTAEDALNREALGEAAEHSLAGDVVAPVRRSRVRAAAWVFVVTKDEEKEMSDAVTTGNVMAMLNLGSKKPYTAAPAGAGNQLSRGMSPVLHELPAFVTREASAQHGRLPTAPPDATAEKEQTKLKFEALKRTIDGHIFRLNSVLDGPDVNFDRLAATIQAGMKPAGWVMEHGYFQLESGLSDFGISFGVSHEAMDVELRSGLAPMPGS
ncbi:unnamed protein product [Effrenium voratum]|nr:unnamed protein product [Effrenium voratum]